jgi:polygalacturonase
MKILKLIIPVILIVASYHGFAKEYKASLFGIKSDGITLNTGSIQKAIDYIQEQGGGTLVFYVGRYLTGTVQLKSNVSIRLEEGAILVGSSSVYDYSGVNGNKAILIADGQQNIYVSGKGVVEGQGSIVLEQITQQWKKGFLKGMLVSNSPALIAMNNSRNLAVEGINLVNACGDVVKFSGCKGITVNGVTIKSKVTENITGILISGCDSVIVRDSYFDTTGLEISAGYHSQNVSIVNSINSKGEKLK